MLDKLALASQNLSPGLRKIISNTGWLFADRIIRLGVGLSVGVWIARYLGPGQFGLYNYALAFVALFSAIATLGLDGIVVREIVRDPSCKDEVLGTAFVLKLISGSGTLLLTIGAITLLNPDNSLTRWLVGITAAGTIFQAFDTIDFWFRSQVQSKYTVYARNSAFVFTTIIKVVLIQTQAPLLTFACAGLVEVIVGAVGLTIVYRVNGFFFNKWRVSFLRARGLLKDSWPLIISGVMIMIYMRIDQIMLGEMVGNQSVGIYSAAVRLAEAWYFVPAAIVSSVFPSIVEAKKISDTLFYSRLQRLYSLMALLSYSVAVPATFLSNWLIQLLYGPEYAEAGSMLAILIWSGLFTSLGVARSSFLTTMNWTKLHFMTVSLGCIINVALCLILIPIYEGMGAVIATCFSYWFATHGSCFLYRPLLKTGFMLTRAMICPRI